MRLYQESQEANCIGGILTLDDNEQYVCVGYFGTSEIYQEEEKTFQGREERYVVRYYDTQSFSYTVWDVIFDTQQDAERAVMHALQGTIPWEETSDEMEAGLEKLQSLLNEATTAPPLLVPEGVENCFNESYGILPAKKLFEDDGFNLS